MDFLSYQWSGAINIMILTFEIISNVNKTNKVLVDSYQKLVLNKEVKVQILQVFHCFFYLGQINKHSIMAEASASSTNVKKV